MTRAELRDRVRQCINDTASALTDNFTDAQLNNFIYMAVVEIQCDIEDIDEQFFNEETTGSVTATQTVVTLPAGFRKLIDYRRNDGNNNIQFDIVDRRNIVTSDIFPLNNSRYDAYLTKDSLVYVVPLNEDHTYKMVYTKNISDVAADGDSFDLSLNAQMAVIYNASIMALGSENSKTSFWETKYAEAKNRVIKNLERRSKVQSRRVQVTRE